MADALLPAFGLAAGVMLLAGLGKLRSPGAAQLALESVGLPPRRLPARALGAAEALIGAACLVTPGLVARVALAAAYLALAGGTAVRLQRGERQAPCGCFGDVTASIHRGHVLLNVCLAAVAGAALVVTPARLPDAVAQGPAGAVLLAGIACAVYLTLALLSQFPAAWHAYGDDDA